MDFSNRLPAVWRGDLEDKLGYEHEAWRRRIAAVSDFIKPWDKNVMDLGAGSMHLGNILPKSCEYIPVDYKKTSDKTIVCDFNKKEFPQKKVDVICAIGILEYIKDPQWFLEQIMKSCRKCILTYKGREKFGYSMLYTDEIIDFMSESGWTITMRNTTLDEWTLIAAFEKATPESLRSIVDCTGCGACANICSVDAISMEYADDGYLRPFMHEDKCVHCGKCATVCPQLHKNAENNNFSEPKCYAVWASDKVRMESSSGGFFTVLSERVLENGGYVFGAVWDEEFCCHITEASKCEDLSAMRYSKYVQSKTDRIFRKVLSRLEEGKQVAYYGCPCQIAGLNLFLQKSPLSDEEYRNLITIDLVCFCAPSNKYFQKYLDEEFGIKNVKNVNFRDKSSKGGWSPVSYRVELKNGVVLFPEGHEDPYQIAFHGVLARRDTCDNCTYYRFPRQGDFTIGDFWGIEQNDVSWNDGNGVSVVLANNKKAEGLLESIKGDFKRIDEVPLEWCMDKGNRIGTETRPSHPNKKYFESLLKYKSFREAVDMSINDKYDIGLVCLFNLNTGNNLTNLALYTTLTDLGYSVLLIEQPNSRYLQLDEKQSRKNIRFLKNPYSQSVSRKKFDEKWEYYELNDQCRMFMVGSDQLWRGLFSRDFDFFFLLEWVRSDKFKMNYSTSFGTEAFDGDDFYRARTAFLLRRLNKISVREKSGLDIIKELTGCDATLVLDPVFLCDQKLYDDLSKIGMMRIASKHYVGAYLLDITDKKKDQLYSISNILTNGSYYAMTDYPTPDKIDDDINLLENPAVEEWIAMIKNCDFFITDSFHGVCFAIIFNKQFCVTFDKDNWRGYDRIANILEIFNLSDRMCTDNCESEIKRLISNRIDFENVNNILESKRTSSIQYIKDSIKESFDYKGVHTDLDLISEKEFLYRKEMKTVQRNIKMMKACAFVKTFSSRGTSMNEIVAFGSGTCFKRNIEKLQEFYEIHYVCDNDAKKWDKPITDNIMCISPMKLKEMDTPLVIIMVDDIGMSFEIAKQLNELGINNFTHVVNAIRAMED